MHLLLHADPVQLLLLHLELLLGVLRVPVGLRLKLVLGRHRGGRAGETELITDGPRRPAPCPI